MALARLGVICVLRLRVAADLEAGRLRSLFDGEMMPSRAVQAICTHRRHLSPRVHVFLEFLKGRGEELVGYG